MKATVSRKEPDGGTVNATVTTSKEWVELLLWLSKNGRTRVRTKMNGR